MKKLFYFLVFLILLGMGVDASASVINGTFESGGFSGWGVNIPLGVSEFEPYNRPAGTANVVNEFLGYNAPIFGSHFAALGTGDEWFDVGQGSFNISVSQTLSLNAGAVLSGLSFFYNGDYEEQDSAWVRIYNSDGRPLATPWLEISGGGMAGGSNSVPYMAATPWVRWSWEAPITGNYILTLGATTSGDNRFRSYGFFDDIQVVPEPTSLLLLVLGFISLLGARRLRKVKN